MLINPIKVIPLVLYSVVINLCLFVLACNTEQAEPAYLLNVGNGTGTGRYTSKTKVPVLATPPAMARFIAWEGETLYLLDPFNPATHFLMPEQDAAIEAYSLPIGIVSFRYEVFPILKQYCALEGCHKNSIKQANFDDHSAVSTVSSKIESLVMSDIMPLNGPLPFTLKQPILDWILQGSQNN